VSVAALEFLGGGTPGLERGGNTTVQTRTGDNLAVLGTPGNSGSQSSWYVYDAVNNPATGASCTNTAAFCINDPQGFEWTNGSGTTVGVGTTDGKISGDLGITSGPLVVAFLGGAAVAEGVNGLGGILVTEVGRGSKVGSVCCSCRVAGSGGTDGIFISLMEDGSEIASVEVAGADANACDDAAGTLFCGTLSTGIQEGSKYTGQVKANTDCAGNPTDCVCNFEVLR
jgi:hypothetical protein